MIFSDQPTAGSTAALDALFDAPVLLVAAAPALICGGVYPEERRHVANAVARRQAEFLTARVLARRALGSLGFAPAPLVPYPDRSPRWPAGAVGSISHSTALCAVAVARAPSVGALGLDVEEAVPLDAGLVDLVCTAGEKAGLGQFDGDVGLGAKALFCAKEAFYKCQYPVAALGLDFPDIVVELDHRARRFVVRSGREDVDRLLRHWRFEGRFAQDRGHIFAAAALFPPA